MDLQIPEGTPQEIADYLAKDEVKSVLAAMNKGVADKNKELLGQLSLSKKDLTDLGGLDAIKASLTELADLKRKQEEDRTKTGESDHEAEKRAWKDQLDAANAKIAKYDQERVDAKVHSQLTRALGDDAGVFDVLETHLMRRIKTAVDSSGNVHLSVLTAEGGPMLTEKGDATLKDLVDEFRDNPKFAPLFKAENKSGSGAGGSKGNMETINPFDKNGGHFDVVKQMELFRRDPAKARSLAAKAGFKLYDTVA